MSSIVRFLQFWNLCCPYGNLLQCLDRCHCSNASGDASVTHKKTYAWDYILLIYFPQFGACLFPFNNALLTYFQSQTDKRCCCRVYLSKAIVSSNKISPPNSPIEALLSGKGHSRRMINFPPLTPHCELETTGRNYFSWCTGARLWRKNGANTVYHQLGDSPPQGKLTTRPYRLARAASWCPFTLINLPVFLFQLYQSNLSEDTQH